MLKKAYKHWIISKEHFWLHVARKTWHVVHRKYFEHHAIESHPAHVNLHVVTLDEEGRMSCTYKSPNREGIPCPVIFCITEDINPLMFNPR